MVGKPQPHFGVGLRLAIAGDRRGDDAPPEPQRRGDPQHAARRSAAHFGDARLRPLDRLDDLPAMFEKNLAGLGQAHVPGRARRRRAPSASSSNWMR